MCHGINCCINLDIPHAGGKVKRNHCFYMVLVLCSFFLFQVTKAVLSFSSKAKKTKKDATEKEEPMDVVIISMFAGPLHTVALVLVQH